MDTQVTPMRRKVKWFSKNALIEAARYTIQHQIGEPPSEPDVLSDTIERFPAIGGTLHDTPDYDPRMFFRCCVFVRGQGYRVAVTPETWHSLPTDEFDLPLLKIDSN
jgi:hypothetical protein